MMSQSGVVERDGRDRGVEGAGDWEVHSMLFFFFDKAMAVSVTVAIRAQYEALAAPPCSSGISFKGAQDAAAVTVRDRALSSSGFGSLRSLRTKGEKYSVRAVHRVSRPDKPKMRPAESRPVVNSPTMLVT